MNRQSAALTAVRKESLPHARKPSSPQHTGRPAGRSATRRRPEPAARARITPAQPVSPLQADDFGVIWLDCGGQPVREALASLTGLAAELEGEVKLIEEAPTYAVALVSLPPASFARF